MPGGSVFMDVVFSYQDQEKRKIVGMPYYELEAFCKMIYENDKGRVDFNFEELEKKYTYFTPYFDYALLHKNACLQYALMDQYSIYKGEGNSLIYHSSSKTGLHARTNTIPFSLANDEAICLNYTAHHLEPTILLPDGTTFFIPFSKQHDLTMDFYLHYLLMNNEEVAMHYEKWKETIDPKKLQFDVSGTYLCSFLGVIRYGVIDNVIYYTENKKIQTDAQNIFLAGCEHYPCHKYNLDSNEVLKAKQLMKSIF